MKPGKPLGRKTGLARGDSQLSRSTLLTAHADLSRSPSLPRAPFRAGRGGGETPQQARRATQLREWKELRELVLERDDWTCVRCGRSDLRLECHHRRHRGQGGSKAADHPANLVSLCGWGNHTGCHGWSHTYANTLAAAVGLTVLWGEQPLDVPVRYPDGRDYLLDDDGDRAPYGGAA